VVKLPFFVPAILVVVDIMVGLRVSEVQLGKFSPSTSSFSGSITNLIWSIADYVSCKIVESVWARDVVFVDEMNMSYRISRVTPPIHD
jgi:hypothetical protein